MDYREDLLNEFGYTICPISFPEYVYCDKTCNKCPTYIEFRKNLQKGEKFK